MADIGRPTVALILPAWELPFAVGMALKSKKKKEKKKKKKRGSKFSFAFGTAVSES